MLKLKVGSDIEEFTMSEEQILIEPGEAEKTPIRSIAKDLVGLARKSPQDMGEEIRAFASEAQFDLFSHLKASPHAALQSMGEGLKQRAAFLTHALLIEAAKALMTYIGEDGHFSADTRQKILSAFIISKKEFGERTNMNYDRMPEAEKVLLHADQAIKFADGWMKEYVLAEASRDRLLSGLKQTTPGEDPFQFEYPLGTHPEFIGFIYAECLFTTVTMQHVGRMRGLEEKAIQDRVGQIREAYVKMLMQPRPEVGVRNFVRGPSSLQ